MEYFREDNNRQGKIYGAIAMLLYAATWVALLLLVNFSLGKQSELGEGIMIAFGNSDSGFGPDDLPLADVFTQSGSSGGPSGGGEAMQTQDYEEAPAVLQQPPTTRPQSQNNQTTQQQGNNNQNTQSTSETPRTADPRAIFQGRTEGSEATSQGVAGGEGNQGNPAGVPGGDPTGTGLGSSGNGFDLSGRSLRGGSLPLPAYDGNAAGRVIITITVNRNGDVTNAVYRPVGSTTNDRQLVNAALAAARRATFSPDEAVAQTGTITYNFILE